MRKSRVFVFLLLALCLVLQAAGPLAEALPSHGADVIDIYTAEQLNEIRNDLTAHYRLMNAIDMTGVDWTPVGTNSAPFTGTLDGNGFVITNLDIAAPTRDLVGLFGRTNGTVVNLGLVSVNIMGGFTVGALTGANYGEIRDCYIAGVSTVFGEGYVGGLVGYNSGVVTRSYSTAFVEGGGYVGGFVGGNAAQISQCFATGNVKTDSSYIGGFAGAMLGETGSIQNSLSRNEVETNNLPMSSGFIGHIIAGQILNCYTVSNSPNGFHYSGSAGAETFAAHSGVQIERRSASMLKRSLPGTPASVSEIAFNGAVTGSFFNSTSAFATDPGNPNISLPEARTAEQLMNKATYAGWDFTAVWDMDEGGGYPYLRGMAKPDKDGPAVRAVLPGNGETIGLNPMIRILAEDNEELLELHTEYELNGVWQAIDRQMIAARQSYGHMFVWYNGGFAGGAVNMRAYAVDKAGNKGADYLTSFTVKNGQVNEPTVTAVPGDMNISLNIAPIPGGATYRLYSTGGVDVRQLAAFDANGVLTGGTTTGAALTGGTPTGEAPFEYTDHYLDPNEEYSYFAQAVDTAGNIVNSGIVTATPLNVDKYPPVAFAGYGMNAAANMPARFDALLSEDNVGIVSYEWDFGDTPEEEPGEEEPGDETPGEEDPAGGAPVETLAAVSAVGTATPTHVYTEPGEYEVTLTVRDAYGNEDRDSILVTVLPGDAAGILDLNVVDDGTGEALANVSVYADFVAPVTARAAVSGGAQIAPVTTRADANGRAQVVSSAQGAQTVYAFMPGYLPEEKVIQFENGAVVDSEIRLTKGEVALSSLNTRKLSYDELAAMGIDVNDISNYNTFSVNVSFTFQGVPLPPMDLIVNGDGQIWHGGSWHGGWYGGGGFGYGGYGGGGTIYPQAVPSPIPGEDPTLVFMNVSGSGYFLKNFFGVDLLMQNQASSSFPLMYNTAGINLQDGGLSLAPMFGGQDGTVDMADIAGGGSGSASWILRADAAGDHTINTAFNGRLMPFGAATVAEFSPAVTVNDSQGLVLIVTPDQAAYEGKPFNVSYSLVNRSADTLYNLSFQFGGSTVSSAALAPGGSLGGSFAQVFSAGTGRDDLYYQLIDMSVKLSGITVELNWNAPKFGNIGYGRQDDYGRQDGRANAPGTYISISPTGVIETKVSDPVDIVNGNLTWEYTDFEMYGSPNLSFKRFYNSQDEETSVVGRGWRHSFDYRLVTDNAAPGEEPSGGSPDAGVSFGGARVTVPNGRSYTFTKQSDGTYILAGTNKPDVTLEAITGGHMFMLYDGTRVVFDSGGKATQILDTSSNVTELTYLDGHIASAQNDAGIMYFEYDGSGGGITGIHDGYGRAVKYTYDGQGRPSAFTNPDGDSINFTYDREHNLTEVTDFNGSVYMRNRYASSQVLEQYLADQGTTRFAYNAAARTTTVTNPLGEVMTYTYDANFQITSVTGRNGQKKQVFEDGLLVLSTDEQGYETAYGYDANGNLITATYPDGTQESYLYNAMRQPTQVTYRDGSTETYTYDGNGNQISYTDREGHTRTGVYDANNNLLSATDANGAVTQYTYDANGNVTGITDAEGNLHQFEYDQFNRMISETLPGNETTRYTYTPAGKLTGITGPDGQTRAIAQNGNGYILSMTDPDGHTEYTTYDKMNKPVSVTDAEGNKTSSAYNAAGNLTQTTDPMGNITRYEYNGLNQLTRVTDPNGNAWQYAYDTRGQVTRITDPLGNSVSLVYDPMGQVLSTTNAMGAATAFTYDSMGRVTGVTDALGGIVKTEHDKNGNVTAAEDANGNRWLYEYDSENLLTKETNPAGAVTAYTYDGNGNLTQTISDAGGAGVRYTYQYDANGRLASTLDAQGNETRYSYDVNGQLSALTNADGTNVTFAYNPSGHLIRETDAGGNVTSYTTDNTGRVLATTDAMGNTTSFSYDRNGRLLSETDPLGGITRYAYDRNGNVTSVTDAGNNITRMTYDALDRLATLTDPAGNISRMAYDAGGNITAMTDAAGNVTRYGYDLLDRLTQTTDPAGGVFTNEYDANGNVLAQTDALGNRTAYVYDALNRVTQTTNPVGGVMFSEYDALGNIIKTTDEENAVTTYNYDTNGQVTAVTDALGNSTNFTYDAMGRVTQTVDAKGNTTQYAYNANGLLTAVTDAAGTIGYTYDALGQLITETDRAGATTYYERDSLGRVTAVTDALGNCEAFSYDITGRITSVTDKNGRTTRYAYDANGNVVEAKDASGVISTFAYDGLNRLVKATTPSGAATLYSYDGRGLVTREVQVSDQVSDQVNALDSAPVTGGRVMVYDGNGNLISLTDEDGNITEYGYNAASLVERVNYSDGKQANFRYDNTGRLVEVNDWTGQTGFTYDLLGQLTGVTDSNNRSVGYGYDAVGNQTELRYPDGSTVTRAFDSLGRVTDISTNEGSFRYTYDLAGYLESLSYPNGITERYSHDALGQLTGVEQLSASGTTQLASYTYNPVGEIVSQTTGGAEQDPSGGSVSNSTFNGLNQLTAKTVYDLFGRVTGSYEYAYDLRGNMVKETDTQTGTTQTYEYDATNKMVRGVNHAGEVSEYEYNALGVLVNHQSVTSANGTVDTEYINDYSNPVHVNLAAYGGNNIDYSHVYGIGLERLSTDVANRNTGASAHFNIQNDRLGSGISATDAAGNVAARTVLDEWGQPLAKELADVGGAKVELLNNYTNHEYDAVLGVYYAKARFYGPENRRFMAKDPVQGSVMNPQSLNPYAYVMNNPIRSFDPMGEAKVDILNTIAKAYMDGLISKDDVGTLVIVANVVESATETIGKVTDVIDAVATFDFTELTRDFDEDIIDADPSYQAIYLSFHETAQILAAKEIKNAYPEQSRFLAWYPELESRRAFSRVERDITFGDYVWEVKPGYAALSQFTKSLEKYVKGYGANKDISAYSAEDGWLIPGGTFPGVTARMFEFNGYKVNITTKWLGPGKIGYFMSIDCPEYGYATASVKNKDAATVLKPIFDGAYGVNTATEVLAAIAAAGLAILSPVPGDEAIAIPALTEVFSFAY